MPYSVPGGHWPVLLCLRVGQCWRQFPHCVSLVCAERFKVSCEDDFPPRRKHEQLITLLFLCKVSISLGTVSLGDDLPSTFGRVSAPGSPCNKATKAAILRSQVRLEMTSPQRCCSSSLLAVPLGCRCSAQTNRFASGIQKCWKS